jgi:cell wall-associated NlpC family hydrolase
MTSRPARLLPTTLVLVLVAALLSTTLGPARADTAADLADAMDEVADLQARTEAASQRVRQAQSMHDDATRRLAELAAQVAAQQAAVVESERALGRVARASYTAGGLDAALYLLLADDGENFAAAAQDLYRVAASTATDLSEHQARQEQLQQLQQAVAEEEARAAKARADAATAAADVRRLLAAAQAREAALERKYQAELAERRRQEAAAAAAAAAAARQAAGDPPTGAAAAAPSTDVRAPTSAPAAPAGASGDQRQRIVSYALGQVGGRYVFGADGPGSFDCSGLVSAAYAAGGVFIPSYTRAQAARVRAIPLSAAQPGDLLFYFGRGADHVAIYLGDGRMVHAVNPRRGITVDSVANSWYAERFTMAGSVLG